MREDVEARPTSVVHDYLTQRGGAERVALLLAQRFGGGAISVLVADQAQTFEGFATMDVRSTWLSKIAAFRRDPRAALPLLPIAALSLKVPAAAVTLCSSSGWAHGVRNKGAKVVYCHNVARWLYQPDAYFLDLGAVQRLAGRLLRRPLIAWDQSRARSVDQYIANSRVVQQRISEAYGRDAVVINPPVMLEVSGPQSPIPGVHPGYHLTVSRPRGYKRTEQIVEAFREMPDQRLVVVGSAPAGRLPGNVNTLDRVTDDQLRWLYANCMALIAVSDEDFGLTPVECHAFGRPVLVLRSGGYLETVVDGRTGLFIETPDPAVIRDGVRRLGLRAWDADQITRHAQEWSVDRFIERIDQVLTEVRSR